MEDNRYSLVIVDVQHDFCDPNGTMFVKGADKLPQKIIEFIQSHRDKIFEIIFTLDWHPYTNREFKKNGGKWPVHCLQHSKGASIPDELINEAINSTSAVSFLKKGTGDWVEYGAGGRIFKNTSYCKDYDYSSYDISTEILCSNDGIVSNNTKFVFCGLCGDYCVMDTIKNFMIVPDFEIAVIPDLVLSIDGGTKFNNFIKENNIKTIQ
jgi:hypothetical protein